MKSSRFVLLGAAACLLLPGHALRAQAPAPFTPDKQFSSSEVMQIKGGKTLMSKVYMDGDKMRTETAAGGMNIIAIVLAGEKKMYSLMPAEKIAMEMTLDPKQLTMLQNASGQGATFTAIGPDTVDGISCTKYKMTGQDNKVFYWWIGDAARTPVKMTTDDGSYTLSWVDYKAGPQDPALFTVPSDYRIMPMPAGPGGAPAPGPQ